MNNLNKEKNVIFNLKKLNIKKSDSKYLANNYLLNFSISENNIKGKSNVQIKKNNFNLSNKYFLSNSNSKRNKTFNFNNNVIPRKKEKRTLSEEEKKKLKLILKKFKKNKLATKQLFNNEKKILLNSINQSNFNFLINENDNNKKKINMRKSLSFILCSSMINKFNNKTSSILDNPFSKKIKLYKNIFNFRKKIINDYIDQDKIIGNMESSKIKYKDALDYFEEKREIKIQKLLKSEKQFYKLKNKEIGIYEIDLDDEGEDNKENNRRYNSFKSSKNFDFIQIKNENNNENLINIKKRTLSSKNFNFKFILSKKIITNFLDKNNNKNSLDNKIYFNYENEGENKKEKIQKTSNHINESLESKKFFIENTSRINSNTININNKNLYNLNNFNYNNIFSKNKKKILKNPIFNNNSEYKVKQYKKKFLLFQKKKITERSKKFANSMANMYFFQYKPKDYIDYKNSTLNINSQNLTRVIKLNRINKYLCDVEDDDLLVINSKKLRQLMKQAELKYYLCNKKDFELSYLKKNLKPQTISKFCRIKNSFFGLPC